MPLNLLAAADVLRTVGSVLLAILILLAMITVHECGHYLAGRLLRFRIQEFSVGFGPALFKRTKKNGEVFALRLIPLGGYCAFAGEEEEEGKEALPGAFYRQKPWRRILVLLAGAAMNYLFALLLIILSFFACGQLQFMAVRVQPAATSFEAAHSLQEGDVILSCEGRDVYLVSDLMQALEGKEAGELVTLTLSRRSGDGREVVEEAVALRADADFANLADTAALWRSLGIGEAEGGGFAVASVSYRGFGFFQTLGRAFVYSARIGGAIFRLLGQLLTGSLGISALGGPVTTVALTAEIASRSLQQFLEIAAYIGVNLAVFNLLPIPSLDGSKVIFTCIEWVRGKPVNRKAEAAIHFAGLILLLAFAVLVDVLQWV